MKTYKTLKRGNKCTLGIQITLSAFVLMPMIAKADLSPALDRLSISVGELIANPKLDVGINTAYGNLQTGDVLLGKQKMPRIKADIMLLDGHGISFDSYQYKHNYSGRLGDNGNIGGNAITTVGNANLDIELSYAKLAYKWWLGTGNTVFGLGVGAAYYKLNLNASAGLNVNGTNATVKDSYTDNALAPLLDLGFRYAITPDFRIYADASGMKKSGGITNGSIYNEAVGVEWFPVKNVGAVLQYGVSEIKLNHDATIGENLKLKLQGPSAFIKARF